jgi:hypothetical protein
MPISIIGALPNQLREQADIAFEASLKKEINDRNFIYLKSNLKRLGLKFPLTIEQQALFQYLAHHGCVISCAMLGFSLSKFNKLSGPILCEEAAFEYLFLAYESIWIHINEKRYSYNIGYLSKQSYYPNMCSALLKHGEIIGVSPFSHEVLAFAELEMKNTNKRN